MNDATQPTLPTLTLRQRDVLALVTLGFTAKEIGGQLGISPRTVRAHIDALKRKLGVSRSREMGRAYRLRTGLDPGSWIQPEGQVAVM